MFFGTRISHGSFTLEFFEHEIRRRPTDRREVIKRIKADFLAYGLLLLWNL